MIMEYHSVTRYLMSKNRVKILDNSYDRTSKRMLYDITVVSGKIPYINE